MARDRKPIPGWASVLAVVAAVVLLFAPGPSRQLESAAGQVLAPVQLAVSGALGEAQEFFTTVRRVREMGDKNERYRVELDRLESELVRVRELELENEALRRLLGLKQRTRPGELLPVRVVASELFPFVRALTVDRGARDGVGDNMAVVTWQGLAGRVLRTTAGTSKVLLLTDVNSSVSVRVQDPSSRATGIARGLADGTLLLEHVEQQEPLQPGQTLISSGLGGIYPEGLVVGRIKAVQKRDADVFQSAIVDPAVDFAKLERVYVILSLDPSPPE